MGERIKARRLELGLSQKELANRSGISRAQIINLENGKCNNIQSKTAAALAEALNTTMAWIFCGISV